MPKGHPEASSLANGEITFFSIDTDLIQGAGYQFEAGALNQLPNQLPRYMGLQITEVVSSEIVAHRMSSVLEAIEGLRSASHHLKRVAKTPLAAIDASFAELDVESAAREMYRKQVDDYAERCRGAVLTIGGPDQAADLFKLYFSGAAPFGKRTDKKSEFPDAMSLLLLERFAIAQRTKGIIASKDAGWTAYAEASDHLYAVKSIEELATLFEATHAHAATLKAKILAAVQDENSTLRKLLTQGLHGHVGNSEWDAEGIYSGSHRIEAEAYQATLESYEIDTGSIRVWQREDDPSTWSVELEAKVVADVDVSVEFFVWDSIDREELSMGTSTHSSTEELTVSAYLSCREVRVDSESLDWDIEVDIADHRYHVTGFEVELDLSDDDFSDPDR